MASDSPTMCGSCGDEAVALVHVRRLYIVSEPAPDPRGELDHEPPVVTEGDVEWWCEVCRIHYPHEVV